MNRNMKLALLGVFALLLCMSSLSSQAQTKRLGRAIGSGNIVNTATDTSLQLQSSISYNANGVYFGFVFITGKFNGSDLFLSTGIFNPVFSSAPGLRTVSASTDITIGDTNAFLTFTWSQNVTNPKLSGVTWTVQAYNDGDDYGAPTGDVLSDPGDTLTGPNVFISLPR